MAEFDGSFDQRKAVRRALKDLHEAGYSDRHIVDQLARDVSAGKVAGVAKSPTSPISRPTLNRIRQADDDVLMSIRTPQMKAVYAFLRQSNELKTKLHEESQPIRSSHHLAPFLDSFQRTMRAKDGPLTNEKLKSLVGAFYLYRKAWTSPYADSYVRCVLRFEWVGEALFYTEEQQFYDSVEKLPVDETDEGVVIPFGMNVALLGRGTEKDLLKFFSLHDFTP